MSSGDFKPKLTPMLTQYLEIKGRVPDCILFYRMGDFYEMFFDDAVRAAPVLDVQLTSRDKNAEAPIPMCGVPHHAAEGYIEKLVSNGFKVAICEQVGEANAQKGIIRREIVRTITPGLIGNPDLVKETAQHCLMALHPSKKGLEIVVVELLSGRVWREGDIDAAAAGEFIQRFSPQEVLLAQPGFAPGLLGKAVITIRPQYFANGAFEACKLYVKETQGEKAVHTLSEPTSMVEAGHLKLDSVALSALEVLESHSEGVKGSSLFECLDRCETAMGRRLLRDWLVRPLAKKTKIVQRLDAVDYLIRNPMVASSLTQLLKGIRDLERLATKTALGLSMPIDLIAVRDIQKKIPVFVQLLQDSPVELLKKNGTALDPLTLLISEIEAALLDSPPATHFRNGSVFRDSYQKDIGELRYLSRNAKELLFALEEREKKNSGISSLKVRYSRVFGYGIEVTKAHLAKVPDHFIRRQTLANGERYVTIELKELEEKIISADDRLNRLEEQLFIQLREKVSRVDSILKKNATILAEIDVILSFSIVARERSYVRPRVSEGFELSIFEGRHPVIECLVAKGAFVPNSVRLAEDSRTLLITGPNMAGKSTIMRQVALIALLAHCGSFVPCEQANIPLLDAIFTRIGSSDNLAKGQSTFMVEMTEMAKIVSQATQKSLILVDEIGRGTSTYDGLSLAWSLLEYLSDAVKAKTLFATHFHELTALEGAVTGLRNVSVLVENNSDGIVFLHRLSQGACSRSYGIEVAKLAGLPPKLLLRAKELLGLLESQSQRGARVRHKAMQTSDKQLGFLEM